MAIDPTLKEIYSYALETWPLVAGAYALLWVTLMIYVGMTLKRLSGLGKQLEVLEAAVTRRAKSE